MPPILSSDADCMSDWITIRTPASGRPLVSSTSRRDELDNGTMSRNQKAHMV